LNIPVETGVLLDISSAVGLVVNFSVFGAVDDGALAGSLFVVVVSFFGSKFDLLLLELLDGMLAEHPEMTGKLPMMTARNARRFIIDNGGCLVNTFCGIDWVVFR